MVATTRRLQGTVDLSPTAETTTIEFPSWVPNPNIDNGSFTRDANNPIISSTGDEDRTLVNSVVEDPRRNRLLMLVHHRLSTDKAQEHGRYVDLYSAPWGSPGGPWTKLSSGFIPRASIQAIESVDTGTETFTLTGHGYVENDVVYFGSINTLTGVTALTPYYVIATGLTANAFKVSATVGGSAVDIGGTLAGETVMGFDAGCVYNAAMRISGDTLYIVYNGHPTDGSTAHSSTPMSLGLATYDLTDTSTYVATKTGQLLAGTAPYRGGAPSLQIVDGEFFIFVNQPGSSHGAFPYSLCPPRLFRSNQWVVTNSAWTLDSRMVDYSSNDYFMDLAHQSVHLGGMKFIIIQHVGATHFRAHLLDLSGDGVVWDTQSQWLSLGASGQWDDGATDQPAPLYHNGEWHLFYAAHDGTAANIAIGHGTYDFTTQQSQSLVTIATNKLKNYIDVTLTGGNTNASGQVTYNVATGVATGGVAPTPTTDAGNALLSCYRVAVEGPGSSGQIRTASVSGTTITFTIYKPTAGHTHTENTAASYTQSATTDANTTANGAVFASSGLPSALKFRAWGKPV